jgi:hypothetical protein
VENIKPPRGFKPARAARHTQEPKSQDKQVERAKATQALHEILQLLFRRDFLLDPVAVGIPVAGIRIDDPSRPALKIHPSDRLSRGISDFNFASVQSHLLARLFRYAEISYHGGFINLAAGATCVPRIDPQCWKRTRRVNKHATPLRQRQEDGSNCRAN